MKKRIQIILLVLLIGIGSTNVFAQAAPAPQDSVKKKFTANDILHKLAYNYMNGINTEVNYENAKRIYKKLAEKQDAKAMNALGMMYKQGLGVAQSNDSARYYYEQSAALKNPKALYNLGLIYKNGDGVGQDFTKSFDYFNRALSSGEKGAYYAVGYFYYKGIGVDQDYSKAVGYFQSGSDLGIPSCQYMNGFCHLKGYGVPQDTVQGKQLIAKAAAKNCDKAIDFINGDKINKALTKPIKHDAKTSVGTDTYIPGQLTKNKRQEKDKIGKTKIDGLWSGKLVTYDWSGNQIEQEQKLDLVLSSDGNTLSGSWTQDDSISIRIEGSRTDSNWVFTNSKYQKEHRRSWEIKQGSFALVQDGNQIYLKGSINKNTLNTKEPAKPQYIVLQQAKNRDAEITTEDPVSVSSEFIRVQPNPVLKDIHVKISLFQAQDGSIELYDQAGKTVYSSKKSNFEKGITEKEIMLDLERGTYTLHFNGKQTQLSTLIIKK